MLKVVCVAGRVSLHTSTAHFPIPFNLHFVFFLYSSLCFRGGNNPTDSAKNSTPKNLIEKEHVNLLPIALKMASNK